VALSDTTISAVSNNGTERDQTHTFLGQYTAALSSNTLWETRGQLVREKRPRDANVLQPLLTGQVGNVVASELCTVIDDAQLLQSRGSINVDDEGNEPESSVLIEKGKLRGYMQDRHSASFFKTKSTGNGRRESFACAPMPRMTNTILLAGPHDPEEILKSVKRGVFAKKFGGGQVDISNGDFVFSLTESYLVEDGKITAPLKGVNLIGNGPDAMRKVTMLGNDVEVSDGIWTCGKDGQSVPVGVGCPTIKIDRMTIGGTKIG